MRMLNNACVQYGIEHGGAAIETCDTLALARFAMPDLDCYTLANLNRDPKKGKPFRPSDFNPFTPQPPKIILRGEEMKEALKAAFCRGDAR